MNCGDNQVHRGDELHRQCDRMSRLLRLVRVPALALDDDLQLPFGVTSEMVS